MRSPASLAACPHKRATILLVMLSSTLLAACGTSSVTNNSMGGLGSAGAKAQIMTASTRVTSPAATEQLRRLAHQATVASNPVFGGYRIGPQDVLQVSVFNVPELSKAVEVAEGGTINYPLIGETLAAGRTTRDLEISLARSLGAKYLQKPQVSVMITKHNSQRVTIEGAVKRPGVYPLLGKMSLLQLVATAEGLSESSDDNVIVFRQINGHRTAARFSVESVRNGTRDDPSLQPGDVIIANTSASKKLFNNILRAMPVAGLFALL
ncbi:MAG: polysaccharide export outer membrane protein [Alphaproteobacteria bacterium]|jgi:polysaccharide export outer membrane protein